MDGMQFKTNTFKKTIMTREEAKEFKDCFSDLIKEAYPLI